MATITRNALESDRFDVAFGRLDMSTGETSLEQALACADADGIAVVSARVDTLDLTTTRRLEALGFRLMDTLVYYRRPTGPPPMIDDAVIPLGPANADTCGIIAGRAFHGYLGHYHADPRLANAAADAAYVDWATRLLAKPGTGQIALGAVADEQVVGFIVGVPLPDGGSDIVLNAVDPDHQGRGWYGALLNAYLTEVHERDDTEVVISTQLQNYAVQRVWRRAGFQLYRSFHTLHRWAADT